MKQILILLFLLPALCFAKDKQYANVCDSLSKVVPVNATYSAAQVGNNIENALKSYAINKNDIFTFNKINDSTIIANGTFTMEKVPGKWKNERYGLYYIPANSDGKVSFVMTFKTKEGKYKYDVTNIKHFGCKNVYGDLCDSKYDDFVLNGLKIRFLTKIEPILLLINKANEANEW